MSSFTLTFLSKNKQTQNKNKQTDKHTETGQLKSVFHSYNSLTYPSTPPNTPPHHRNTPIPTPSGLHINIINIPTDPPTHTTFTTNLSLPKHKMAILKIIGFFCLFVCFVLFCFSFSKTHSAQSNSHCPCV